MIVSCAPFRVSFAGGGSEAAEFYRRRRAAILSCAIDKYTFVISSCATPPRQLIPTYGGCDAITTHGERLHALRLVVAAGTLGSLRLVARLLAPATELPVFNSQVMGVPLLVTGRLGERLPTGGHSLAQLGFRLACSAKPGDCVSGTIDERAGLPPSSFPARMPLGRRAATEISRALALATIYFPGRYSGDTVTLRPSAQGKQGDQADEASGVEVRGGLVHRFDKVARTVRQRLTRVWRKFGAAALPAAALATAGTDALIGGVFAMGIVAPHGTNKYGELHAAPRLRLADGSVLPSIPSKFTTLTIMANADRIGRYLAKVA